MFVTLSMGADREINFEIAKRQYRVQKLLRLMLNIIG
jgi:hypothetical protein